MAQHLGGNAAPDISIFRIFGALAACLLIAMGAIFALRRYPQRLTAPRAWPSIAKAMMRERRIEVIEARRISVHADLCLARCDGVEYLLLCGPSGAKVLKQSGIEPPTAPSPARDA